MRTLFILFATSVCAMAGEYAVLTNGQRIHADSHEKDGGMIRLLNKSGATIEFPADKVSGFEQEEYVAPPPAPAVQTVAAVTPVANSRADGALSPREIITQAALKVGLPPEILHSVAKAESGYHANAVSPKGAIGLMQLMPQTAASLNANPYDPRQNAEAGAEYLARLLIKYQDDKHQVSKAVAAYNAGPGAVDKYKGVPPYRETVNYVNRVINDYNKQTAKKRAASVSLTD